MSSNFANSWQKHILGNLKQTQMHRQHISFHMFVLYRVYNLATIFTAYGRPTAAYTKSSHKSQIVASDNICESLSCRVFSNVSAFFSRKIKQWHFVRGCFCPVAFCPVALCPGFVSYKQPRSAATVPKTDQFSKFTLWGNFAMKKQ